MADDIILNKAEIIANCRRRIDAEYAGLPDNLRQPDQAGLHPAES